MNAALTAKAITFGYQKNQSIIQDVTVPLVQGGLTTIIGQNGSGKSTLLKCLAAELSPQFGQVYLRNRPLSSFSTNERAKRIAVVHQTNRVSSPATVRTVVSFGRTPYRKFLQRTDTKNTAIVSRVLELTHLSDLADRPITSLSGGQTQRVWLAMAMAQDPEILLLDEPTTYLDINTQIEFLSLVRHLVTVKQLTVGAVLHDIDQVLRFSDQTAVMKAGKIIDYGPTSHVMTPALIHEAFGVNAQIYRTKNHHQVIDYL